MMRFIITSIFITLLFSSFQSLKAQAILENSKEYIHTFDNTDYSPLIEHIDRIAENSRIIGLGEVSHYTKECYELKHKIISKLIENNYNALILEVDFGQALLWNEYVTHEKGNIDELIEQSGWFTYRTQEFKNLLIDIRNHNKTSEIPFQIIGMEMTAMNHNLSWLKEYFKPVLEESNSLFNQLNQERKIVAFNKHEKSEILSYWELFYAVRDTLTKYKTDLINVTGENNFQIANQIAEIIRQYSTYISQDESFLQVEFRDQFSLRNVFWSLNYLGDSSKVAIWAHNGHIVKKSVLADYDVLGYYLNKWFGSEYYSIGFTFNQGEFGAFSNNGFKKWSFNPVKTHSLTQELHNYNSEFLFFDIQSTLQNIKNPKSSKLFIDVPIRTDISEYFSEDQNDMMNINLSESYDCMIYIDKTTYPTTIEWNR